MMRLYNLKAGLTPDKEKTSKRYSSQPVDGPAKDKPIQPHFDKMVDTYYQLMGWDRKTGMPLPATLKALDIEEWAK